MPSTGDPCDFKVLARSLNPPITAPQAGNAIKLLLKLNLIERLPSGRHRQIDKFEHLPDNRHFFIDNALLGLMEPLGLPESVSYSVSAVDGDENEGDECSPVNVTVAQSFDVVGTFDCRNWLSGNVEDFGVARDGGNGMVAAGENGSPDRPGRLLCLSRTAV